MLTSLFVVSYLEKGLRTTSNLAEKIYMHRKALLSLHPALRVPEISNALETGMWLTILFDSAERVKQQNVEVRKVAVRNTDCEENKTGAVHICKFDELSLWRNNLHGKGKETRPIEIPFCSDCLARAEFLRAPTALKRFDYTNGAMLVNRTYSYNDLLDLYCMNA